MKCDVILDLTAAFFYYKVWKIPTLIIVIRYVTRGVMFTC